MRKNASYFISDSNCAYRSEPSAWLHERLTAEDCWLVLAPQGASQFYIVEGRRGSISIFVDLATAMKTFIRIRGLSLESFAVV